MFHHFKKFHFLFYAISIVHRGVWGPQFKYLIYYSTSYLDNVTNAIQPQCKAQTVGPASLIECNDPWLLSKAWDLLKKIKLHPYHRPGSAPHSTLSLPSASPPSLGHIQFEVITVLRSLHENTDEKLYLSLNIILEKSITEIFSTH